MKDWGVVNIKNGVAIAYNLSEIEAKQIAEKIGSKDLVACTYEQFIEIRKGIGK